MGGHHTVPAIALGATLVLAMRPAGATTFHVDDDASEASVPADGSAAHPFPTLSAAIATAASGDTILVARGTYGAVAWRGKTLTVVGGFAGGAAGDYATSAPAANPTVIDGGGTQVALDLEDAGTTRLEGLVITGGVPHGVYAHSGNLPDTNRVTLASCLIVGNGRPSTAAGSNGGGVAAEACELTLVGNTFRDNVGRRGAAVSADCRRLEMTQNLVEDNVGHDDHGGALNLAGEDLTLSGNVFRGNRIGASVGYGWGGAALVQGVGTRAVLEHNVWEGNVAPSVGSALFVDDGAEVVLRHDLFHHNACSKSGGAIYVDGYDQTGSRVTLRNVTVADTTCAPGSGLTGGALYVERHSQVVVDSAILWGNDGIDWRGDGTASVTFRYALSEEVQPGEGNLAGEDPLFAAPADGDYHVRSQRGRWDPARQAWVTDREDSPSIDRGDPALPYDLEPGPNGLRINIGADGDTPEASMGAAGGTPPPLLPSPSLPSATPTAVPAGCAGTVFSCEVLTAFYWLFRRRHSRHGSGRCRKAQ